MIIEDTDYRITPIADDASFYDLELLYVIKPKGKPERQEFKVAGYGMTLSSCIKRIIQYRLSQKFDTVKLEEYLVGYTRELDKLNKLCLESLENSAED